jgi:hypothetical protein
LASKRRGDGDGIFNYRAEANQILRTIRTKTAEGGIATVMFDPKTKQVVFVPSRRNSTFTDPSYHLPAYYELWALWAAEDNAIWAEATTESRAFFHRTANPKTGLMLDYANFDGMPPGEIARISATTRGGHYPTSRWISPGLGRESVAGGAIRPRAGLPGFPGAGLREPIHPGKQSALRRPFQRPGGDGRAEIGEPFVHALWDSTIPRGLWRRLDRLL